ncbi:hydrogenase nickel incorporation protein HypB [Halobiforma haloterrestris]|uniref:Hydrogenase nickel incorporation protein HypB n=1 Tax=Natronobacterium haloterrestre TaxID=148448 RepID=A0A1I1JN08_NATHA|nr:hydrogenase nickel incorporation protein HypB [Halobiforma haloterrestris]SFC49342.1 hydrogenase nickel incorporation protein HypB [Halobiforma haloterrestris]
MYPTRTRIDIDRSTAYSSRLNTVLATALKIPSTLRCHRFGHDDHEHDHDHGGNEDDVLARFREQAADVHERVVHDNDVTCIEFLGATGSGKTMVLERLAERVPAEERVGVVVGDVAGEDDARRLEEHGVETVTVNTGKECHLDASLVDDAIDSFDLEQLDRLYFENVGNMVCPADFPLGAQTRVLVVSVTEGDDVVRKHPLLFQACDATVVNKADLADAVGADLERMRADVTDVAPGMDVFETNARGDDGVDALADFLDGHEHDHETAHAYE